MKINHANAKSVVNLNAAPYNTAMREAGRTQVLLYTDEPALAKGFVDVLAPQNEFLVLPA